MPPSAETKQSLNMMLRPELPTTLVDHVRVSYRQDNENSIVIMSFAQVLPEAVEGEMMAAEVCRLAMSRELLRKIVDIGAKGLKYYPAKPEAASGD